MCTTHEFEDHIYMDWFLISLLSPICKDVSSHFLQSKEEVLQVALKYDPSYAQSIYVYIVLLDFPRSTATNALEACHAIEGIVGSISHHQPPPYAPNLLSYD